MNIDQDLLTEYNPTLTLTINDLDLAGMVLGWLVLQYFWQNLVFNHVGFFLQHHIRGSLGLQGYHVYITPSRTLAAPIIHT